MAKYKDWLTSDNLLKIKQWARLGLTDKQISHNINISNRTFTRWKDIEVDGERPISLALKKGREQAVEILENSMFKKANGFYENGNYYPPDNVSMIFLLKNWAKNQYQDRPKTPEEIESIKLDNELKKLKIELYKQSDENAFAKVEELIARIDEEVESAKH